MCTFFEDLDRLCNLTGLPHAGWNSATCSRTRSSGGGPFVAIASGCAQACKLRKVSGVPMLQVTRAQHLQVPLGKSA
eukprot:472608-Amphidinium_carterae.1